MHSKEEESHMYRECARSRYFNFGGSEDYRGIEKLDWSYFMNYAEDTMSALLNELQTRKHMELSLESDATNLFSSQTTEVLYGPFFLSFFLSFFFFGN